MQCFPKATLTAAALACGLLAAEPLVAGDLRVQIQGVKSSDGLLRAALHAPDGDGGFPSESGVLAAQWRKAMPGTVDIVFADLPPGKYAVAAFHDEDANNTLDENLLGIPIEGFGFSEKAQGSFGPPRFDDAAVAVEEGERTTEIVLSY